MAFVSAPRRPVSAFGALWARLRTRLARRAAYRETYRELAALSDRELNDLSLGRSDIAAIARQAAREA